MDEDQPPQPQAQRQRDREPFHCTDHADESLYGAGPAQFNVNAPATTHVVIHDPQRSAISYNGAKPEQLYDYRDLDLLLRMISRTTGLAYVKQQNVNSTVTYTFDPSAEA